MAKISPFRGLRPKPEFAEQVAALPYDVCDVEEARQHQHNPFHFFHITRAEIDLPAGTDPHGAEVYEKAVQNLRRFVESGTLVRDDKPHYYIYELEWNGRAQTGLMCVSAVEDYKNGIIKKHEFTRPEKEKDRINHMIATEAQTGVVFLAYRNVASLDDLIEAWKQQYQPENDFVAEDGVRHKIWVVNDYNKVITITNIFETDVPATYIADGHHRAASAARVAEHFSERFPDAGPEAPFRHFLTCIFPESQLRILDYNRVVRDLNGLSPAQFLQRLEPAFEVSAPRSTALRPTAEKTFGMYLDGHWYELKARPGTYPTDPIGILDVSILQTNLLDAVLGIRDPRTDDRVAFVGGIRGLDALQQKVDSGEMAAAFSCYPVSLGQLFEVADSGKVMPPKSTWFEPKTRDGLITHLIGWPEGV